MLVLLWIWAICIFTVVDLFRNVDEFDGIRPRSKLYRGMRVAAHKMVGEPIRAEATGTAHGTPAVARTSDGQAEKAERLAAAPARPWVSAICRAFSRLSLAAAGSPVMTSEMPR